MALKLKLKAGEKVYINGALVENGRSSAELHVLNKVTILREKDILLEADADTPCKKVYFAVQSLYLEPANEAHVIRYLSKLSIEIVRAAPSAFLYIDRIHECVLGKRYYSALRQTRELIQYEEELLHHARAAE
jgi:flagellar protein FlbT